MRDRKEPARSELAEKLIEWLALALGCVLLWLGSHSVHATEPKFAWKKFVQVAGQPEPVPEQWVSTPEGRFAHSIRIPNPVPKDSGYRRGMTSEQYFEHLCRTEAGEFIFKTVENVEGFYFMRPPKRPTDDDLMDRYKLEAPDIERTYQLLRGNTEERAMIFVGASRSAYGFIEEPKSGANGTQPYVRASGYRPSKSPMVVTPISALESKYAMVWRGIRRPSDREHAIAGSEWIVFEIASRDVLGVIRNYGRTGRTPSVADGIWWLNALSCPVFAQRYRFATSERIFDFASKILRPIAADRQGGADAK